jgi:hypothetical protein
VSDKQSLPADQGVTAVPSVIAGLGFPNGRAEASATPTGWHASDLDSAGAADQSRANTETIRSGVSTLGN